jgi:YegS/Rv2252/BmrU family lipid kinase
VNPISGRSSKKRVISIITTHIDTKKYDVTIRFTSYVGHATEIAKSAVNDGVDIVVAVGGDGTVNEVARALVKTETILGIIPCGSGNGLARHLHIPMNIRKAVELINGGPIDSIDSLSVNGNPCFCTAGVGYDAQVSVEYAKDLSRGLLTYVKKAVQGWLSYEPQKYIIEIGNQVIEYKAVTIVCANANQWGNEFHVAPKASLKDGLIDVIIIHPIKFKHAVLMPFQILGYSFDQNPDVETLRASSLSIKMQLSNPIQVDGEPMLNNKNMVVELYPNSLKVISNLLLR